MPSDIQVKQFDISEQDKLLSFLRLAYPGEPLKSDPAFWQWQFLENPCVSPDNVPTWIVTDGDKIVGQLAALPIKLKVGEEELRAIWVVNIIVLPEYRGRGLGTRLFEVARESFCQTMIALGYNEQSGAILRRLKWFEMGRINRYHLLLFPGDAAKEISRFAPARHLANLLYAPFRPHLSKLSNANGELREVAEFDAAFDKLWLDAREQWPCAVVRDARFLEWQYKKQPGKKFDVLGYYEDDTLLGYIVLFFRKAEHGGVSHKAAITDLCYSARNSQVVIDSLLKGALRLALERHTGGVVTDVLDASVGERLQRFGFRYVKASPGFMVAPGEREALMKSRSNWFLTRGDSDVSIFEDPNV